MKPNKLPSKEKLLELFDYNPDTGVLTTKKRRGNVVEGTPVTRKGNHGYYTVRINHVQYLAHRVIFKMVHDEEPKEVDHKNTIREDNRIGNLRVSNHTTNSWNPARARRNRSGVPGVSFNNRDKLWYSRIIIHGKRITLGYSKCKALVGIRYMMAKERLDATWAEAVTA